MAVNIELKRSAVPGRVPSTSSLNLGEIAINTYDGKSYFKKDDGTQSIIELASTSGSVASASFAISASYAATASSADNFLVRGTLTAQTIVVQTITSSTEFVTGSTKFGTQLSNTHQFTGSVSITGSLSVTGSIYFTEALSNPQTIITPFSTSVGYNSLLIGPISNSSSVYVVSGSVLKIILSCIYQNEPTRIYKKNIKGRNIFIH